MTADEWVKALIENANGGDEIRVAFRISSPFKWRLTWVRARTPIWFTVWRIGLKRWRIEWPLGERIHRWLFYRCPLCGKRFALYDWDIITLDDSRTLGHYTCYNAKTGPLKVRGREF